MAHTHFELASEHPGGQSYSDVDIIYKASLAIQIDGCLSHYLNHGLLGDLKFMLPARASCIAIFDSSAKYI
jgi:hypothetical protein